MLFIRRLIKKFIFILLLCAVYLCVFKKIKRNHKYQFFLEQKYDDREEAFQKSKNFIKSCLSSSLIKNNQSKANKVPKISVVIPLYNCQKYILRALKSIQLQTLSDFEVILIDDKSKDNTINIINKIKNEDNRIKLMRNSKNMGILYSRSIGVLNAKGKYLFTLDNDDIFLNNDIFDTITKISENGNFDIVEFKAISNRILKNDILNNIIKDSSFSHKIPFILFQPNLGRYPITVRKSQSVISYHDIFLWGKCIKTEVYHNALNKLGIFRYSRYMIRYEDILASYMIFNTAQSFIYVLKYGIYHVIRKWSGADIGKKRISRTINILYLIDIVSDFSLNNMNNRKQFALILIYFLKLPDVRQKLLKKPYRMKIFTSCIRKALNSTLISRYYKTKIIKLFRRRGFRFAYSTN